MNKKTIPTYDAIAHNFAKSRKNMSWGELDYFVEKYLPKNNNFSILDVGCGSGRLLEQLSYHWRLPNEYLGVDNSEVMITEAKNNFDDSMFLLLDMKNIKNLAPQKFDYIFFIASLHHQKFLKERIETLIQAGKILKENGKIFLTNWALESPINKEKFAKSKIIWTQEDFDNETDFLQKQEENNRFGTSDYSIKFGEFFRYYHCFNIQELEFLFSQANLKIVENRLFDNKRNFISVLEKK